MSKVVGGDIYYGVFEACKRAGISKSTYYRWLNAGILKDVSRRDRRGWRLFTQAEIERIRYEADKTIETSEPP